MTQYQITPTNSSRIASPLVPRALALFIITALVGVFLTCGQRGESSAQTSAERLLEDKIPRHLPIKVKLRKENLFKDLRNEQWLRDFELEVTNSGDKPIYYLSLLIGFPEVTGPDGNNVGFGLRYGKNELGDIQSKAGPADIAIKPGETYVLKLRASEVKGWDVFREKEDPSDVTKIILRFRLLSFGDGTGFLGYDGMAVPAVPAEK